MSQNNGWKERLLGDPLLPHINNDRQLKVAILELDPALIAFLLADDVARAACFKEIKGHLMLDYKATELFLFISGVDQRSLTVLSNRIGLVSNDEFFITQSDIVLSFPYKDGVLLGGQAKEEQRREEEFLHLTIHQSRIDRLLEPKVFDSWTRHSKSGRDTVKNLSLSDSYILKGNNLLVMHSLKKNYLGQIDLIYIDPPYNTGSDSFQYNDRFSHSTWLTFMKNRLEVAWQLLAESGAFFIQVDDAEFAYLKVLCDEIFGRANHRETIVLKSSTESGVNAINVKRGERLFKVKEYILFYSKDPNFRFKPFYTKTTFNFNYRYEVIKENDNYIIRDLYREIYQANITHDKSDENKLIARSKLENYCLTHSANIYSLEKNIKKAGAKFKSFAMRNKEKGIVEEFENSFGNTSLVYQGGSLVPLSERIVEVDGEKYFGVLASDLWVDIGTTAATEGGTRFANGKKPEALLRRIIEMTTEEGDLVLDYHLGSGTTAAVAHKLSRRFIGIEQMDYGDNDPIIRLENVINGDATGISKSIQWKGGGSFVSARLVDHLSPVINQIEAADAYDRLVMIYHKMNEKFQLDYTLEHSFFDRSDIMDVKLDDLKKVLISMARLSKFYISLHDIDDIDYSLTEDVKSLNYQFYQL